MTHTPVEESGVDLGAQFSMSVKTLALHAGTTTGKLAPLLGISLAAMSQKVNDRTPWKLVEVARLADAFGIDPGLLLSGPGDWIRGLDRAKLRARLENFAAQSDVGVRDTSAYQGHTGNALAAA